MHDHYKNNIYIFFTTSLRRETRSTVSELSTCLFEKYKKLLIKWTLQGNQTQVGNLLARHQSGSSQTNEIAEGGKGKACNRDSRVGQSQINANQICRRIQFQRSCLEHTLASGGHCPKKKADLEPKGWKTYCRYKGGVLKVTISEMTRSGGGHSPTLPHKEKPASTRLSKINWANLARKIVSKNSASRRPLQLQPNPL